MKPKCIDAVEKAIGRKLSAEEAADVQNRIERAVRRMARANPQETLRRAPEVRMREAAKMAAKEFVGEAERNHRLVELQAAAVGRLNDYIDAQATRGVNRVD